MGGAWDGRRRKLLDGAPDGVLLDLGCGEGRLLHDARRRGRLAIGIDPSHNMVARAHRRGAVVIRASAAALPLQDESVQLVTATYPGPWIFREDTIQEVSRVLAANGEFRVLLGGTIERGPFATIRIWMNRVVYGTADPYPPDLPRIPRLTGELVASDDRWGSAFIWVGARAG